MHDQFEILLHESLTLLRPTVPIHNELLLHFNKAKSTTITPECNITNREQESVLFKLNSCSYILTMLMLTKKKKNDTFFCLKRDTNEEELSLTSSVQG